jgi:hypothetical protein
VWLDRRIVANRTKPAGRRSYALLIGDVSCRTLPKLTEQTVNDLDLLE